MRHRKKYILLFLLLVVCAGLVFFYGIKSEGQEDKQEVLSSVEDTYQVPEAAVDSARQIIGEVEENVSPAENSVEKVVKKPEERPVGKFVDKKQADKRQKVASKREAVAVPPVSSTDIKFVTLYCRSVNRIVK